MKQKPYNPKKNGSYPRVYEPELLSYAPFNSFQNWIPILIITIAPAAVMAALAVILKLSWYNVLYLALGTALVALTCWMSYCAKKGLDRFREIMAAGEYVPERTTKGLRQSTVVFVISLFYPVLFIILIVTTIVSSYQGAESVTTFPFYLFYFPFLFLLNGEISDIIFMPDGFYTGTAAGGMYFIPFSMIDHITDESGRTTKQGETAKIKLFSNGKQFGHDRMYRTELNEIRRRHLAQLENTAALQ